MILLNGFRTECKIATDGDHRRSDCDYPYFEMFSLHNLRPGLCCPFPVLPAIGLKFGHQCRETTCFRGKTQKLVGSDSSAHKCTASVQYSRKPLSGRDIRYDTEYEFVILLHVITR